jgi:hypothetical protein
MDRGVRLGVSAEANNVSPNRFPCRGFAHDDGQARPDQLDRRRWAVRYSGWLGPLIPCFTDQGELRFADFKGNYFLRVDRITALLARYRIGVLGLHGMAPSLVQRDNKRFKQGEHAIRYENGGARP